jgi:hypothetical protein
MGKYGIYSTAIDFYNNLIIDNEIKYIKDSNTTIIGKVVKLTALGVKAITIETADNTKHIIFPKEADKCEIK